MGKLTWRTRDSLSMDGIYGAGRTPPHSMFRDPNRTHGMLVEYPNLGRTQIGLAGKTSWDERRSHGSAFGMDEKNTGSCFEYRSQTAERTQCHGENA